MTASPSPLSGRRILLIVCGGIAAYKSLDLVRRLRERGAGVRAVVTEAGKQFVTPLSLASLTGEKVHEDLFSLTDESEMGHIELSRSADIVLVAPATADIMARAANGLASDLASTLLLATDKQPVYAPAMNVRMWLHPATQRNLATLRAAGSLIVGPDDGEMACGEFGPGRMAEPLAIVAALERALVDGAIGSPSPLVAEGRGGGTPDLSSTGGSATPPLRGDPPRKGEGGALAGVKILITAGPTQEPIDPVRYISNRSSGKQGFAIAQAAVAAGADVRIVSGPVDLPDPVGATVTHVETAIQMRDAVMAALPADVFVATAAVADWRVETLASDKVKKSGDGPPVLRLTENPDILATVSKHATARPKLVVGFAAETRDVVANAQAKLARKGCDLVVANDVSTGTGVFAGTRNTVHIVDRNGVTDWPTMDKSDVATRLVAEIAKRLKA